MSTTEKEKDEKATATSTQQNYQQFETNYAYTFPGKNQPVIDYKNGYVYGMWKNSVKNYGERDCLGFRTRLQTETTTGKQQQFSEYQFISYADCGAIVDRVGSFLSSKLNVKQHENIGLYLNNRPEWILSDFAIHRQGCISVPLYSTFGSESIVYISNHAELRIVFCEVSVLANLIGLLAQLPIVKIIIVVNKFTLTKEQEEEVKKFEVEVIEWTTLEEEGAKSIQPDVPASANDIFSIIYTSGTTGSPKGVLVTNRNALAATEVIHNVGHFPNGVFNEVHFSYLPLTHVYERDLSLNMLRSGAKIGFISGSLSNLMDDIKALRPTFLIGVPRVYKRIYDKVSEQVSKMGFLQRNMFNMALNSKLNAAQNETTTWVNWDSFVFSKLKDMIGGRCRFFLSGAAPLDPQMVPWLEAVFLVEVHQAYGLTESFAGITCTTKDAKCPNSSIGVLTDVTSLRLVDVPEMNYFHTDNPPRGEIVLKGETVFAGYYKNPEMTKEVLSEDGWFSTGDIAQLDPNGDSFSIIDRKKNIFKLAQGEYIAAEKLENVYGRAPGVAQVWIHGEGGDNFIVCVVVPDRETFPEIAKTLGLPSDILSDPNVANNSVVHKYFMDTLLDVGKKAKLAGFEMVKGLLIETEEFTVENNFLTPSFKLIRNNLKLKYKDDLKVLCRKVNKEMKQRAKEMEKQ